VLYESLNFASLKKLPILFVCENNFYSTHMPIRGCRVDSNIYKVAEPFCIRSVQIDGNDVLEVYEAGKQAVEQCRKGKGPVFLECLTYRLRGHVGPDDNIQGTHTDIRPREEIKEWKKKDPIKRFERYLQENEVMDEEEIEEIKEYIQAQMEEALQFASACAFPDPRDLDKNVFAQ
jgi:acetoin:2,6-dichlorophenolindophenol oxidoreductase subunit alpha